MGCAGCKVGFIEGCYRVGRRFCISATACLAEIEQVEEQVSFSVGNLPKKRVTGKALMIS